MTNGRGMTHIAIFSYLILNIINKTLGNENISRLTTLRRL